MRAVGARIGRYTAAVIALGMFWQWLSYAVGSPALPGPGSALFAFARLFPQRIAPHLAISAARVIAAMLVGTVAAVPLGLWMGRSRRLDAWLAPAVFLTYPIPKIVLLPVLLVLLGIGNLSKIALIAGILFFQILVTTRDAARSVAEGSVLSVRSLGAGRLDLVCHVILPAILPDLFTALRISTGTAVAVLFFSESVAGSSGLGWYILDAWGRIAYDEMFAGILAMALLGVGLYEFLEAGETRLCRWRKYSS